MSHCCARGSVDQNRQMTAPLLKSPAERAETSVMPDSPVSPGTKVEVCSRFRRVWVTGFEVVEAGGEGYRLRRLSDHWVLPALFAAGDVRPAAPGRPPVLRVAQRPRARLR